MNNEQLSTITKQVLGSITLQDKLEAYKTAVTIFFPILHPNPSFQQTTTY